MNQILKYLSMFCFYIIFNIDSILPGTDFSSLLLAKGDNIETKYVFLEGNTMWDSDKEPIYGLTIIFNPGKYISKTDYDGNFKAKLPYGKYKVDFYFLNHLLKSDYIIIDSTTDKKHYIIPDLPNQTRLEVKGSF